MKYLKSFNDTASYEAWKNSEDYVLPNVSYTEDGNLYYNAFTEVAISYNMVDLGLPSGLKWADKNVGAETPEDSGLYFQWGDTNGYTAEQIGVDKIFNFDGYFDTNDGGNTFNKYYAKGGLTTLDPSDDAATVHMGSSWRTPTNADIVELVNNTTKVFVDIQGNEYTKVENGTIDRYNLKGVKLIGKNGNSIFIPVCGYGYDNELKYNNDSGYIAAADLYSGSDKYAACLAIQIYGYFNASGVYRVGGVPVRGVYN